jgi:ElaB/YqjD/DUF883 family membrane-anchored ribosome-binding protein
METSTDTLARNRLTQSLKQMIDGADQLLHNAARDGGDQFNLARERFEQQLRSARRELDQLQDSTLYRARRAARATDRSLHEHPYTAVAVTAGVCLAIGWLLSRRY